MYPKYVKHKSNMPELNATELKKNLHTVNSRLVLSHMPEISVEIL